MTFKQRMKIVGYILGGFIAIGIIMAPFTEPAPLTPAQKLEITDYCNQNPNALRCR